MPGWGARRKHPRDPAPVDPKEQAELAREEQFYAIDNPGSLYGPGLMRALMIYRHHSIYQQLAALGNRYSMLHADVLTLLFYLARHTEGNVLEIGPYVGGSTMAVAIGLRAHGEPRLFVTVEKGGAMDRSRIPSRDIVRDLKQNLIENGLADHVQVMVGHSLEPEIVATVRNRLPRQSASLLLIDADGEVRALLDVYHELLADNCWVVIDDYFAIGAAKQKSARTKPQVEAAVFAGELEQLGFYGWGTWVGRWHRDGGGAAKKR